MSTADPAQRRIAELSLRASGANDLLMAKIKEFGGLASMGSYPETDNTRNAIHALMDLYLDATLEQTRHGRNRLGLA